MPRAGRVTAKKSIKSFCFNLPTAINWLDMIGQAGCVAQEVSVASSVGECKWTIALQEPSRRAAKTVVSCEAIQVTLTVVNCDSSVSDLSGLVEWLGFEMKDGTSLDQVTWPLAIQLVMLLSHGKPKIDNPKCYHKWEAKQSPNESPRTPLPALLHINQQLAGKFSHKTCIPSVARSGAGIELIRFCRG